MLCHLCGLSFILEPLNMHLKGGSDADHHSLAQFRRRCAFAVIEKFSCYAAWQNAPFSKFKLCRPRREMRPYLSMQRTQSYGGTTERPRLCSELFQVWVPLYYKLVALDLPTRAAYLP